MSNARGANSFHFRTRSLRVSGDSVGENQPPNRKEPTIMLSWAITFLIIALIAAVLGFGGIAGTAVGIAKILFFVFIVLFVVSLLFHRRTPSA